MAMTMSFDARSTVPVPGTRPRLNFDIPDVILAEVDFKWLMAGHGWHVDVERLHYDPSYAAQMRGNAMGSEFQALRNSAVALFATIDHPVG